MHLSLASSALLFASAITGALACKSESSPNPISSRYPSQVSGNLNGTTMIIPISMAEARKVIPAEYGILENAYRHLLPSFPKDMYPMMATGVLDHDLKFPSLGLSLPDFSVRITLIVLKAHYLLMLLFSVLCTSSPLWIY